MKLKKGFEERNAFCFKLPEILYIYRHSQHQSCFRVDLSTVPKFLAVPYSPHYPARLSPSDH